MFAKYIDLNIRTLVLFGPTLACLRKTLARLTEISKDCGRDKLAALELTRLERELGDTPDGCLCKKQMMDTVFFCIYVQIIHRVVYHPRSSVGKKERSNSSQGSSNSVLRKKLPSLSHLRWCGIAGVGQTAG